MSTMEVSSGRVVLTVAGVHLAAVLALIVSGLIRGCRIQPAEEIVAIVRLETEPPPQPLMAEPEPAPEPDPVPEPEPPPEPEPKPDPKPDPKPEPERRRIRRPDPDPPPAPRLTPEEIQRQLARDLAAPTERPVITDDLLFREYYTLVRSRMYQAWDEPSGISVPAGRIARVLIVVQRDGTISRVALASSSGNATLDASALAAARAVGRLDPLPGGFTGRAKEITIDFRLTGQ